MQPWLGEEEVAAVTEVIALRLGRPGPAGRGVRAGASPSAMQAEHAVAVVELHHRRCTWRWSWPGSGPGDDVVVPSFSFIATANAPTYVGARPVFADVDPVTGNLTAETVAAALTAAHPGRHRRRPGRRAGRPRPDPGSCCDPRGHRRGRGRRLRRRLDLPRPSGRAPAPRSPPGPSTRASSSPPARAACSPRRRRGLGGAGPPAARARDERLRRGPARQRAGAAGGVPRGRLQLPDDRPAGRRRPRAARAAATRSWPGAGELAATYTKHARRHRRACGPCADPAWGTSNFQSFWVEVRPGVPARPRRSCSPASPRPRSPPAAASWPPTGSRPTPAGHRRRAAAGHRAAHRHHPDPAAVPPDDRADQARVVDGAAARRSLIRAWHAWSWSRPAGSPARCSRPLRAPATTCVLLDDDPARRGTSASGRAGRRRARRGHPVRRPRASLVCAGRGTGRARSWPGSPASGSAPDRYATVVHPSVDVPAGCTVGAGQHPARRRRADRRRLARPARRRDAERHAHPRRRRRGLRDPRAPGSRSAAASTSARRRTSA